MSESASSRPSRRAVPAGIVMVLCCVLSACSAVQIIEEAADPSPPASVLGAVEFPEIEGKVLIGLVADLSGDNAELESSFAEQLTSAIEIQNGKGGILGDPVGLLVRDSGNDVDIAIDAVEDLILRDVSLIVMGCNAETVIPAASIANAKGVLTVSPCVTDENFPVDAGDLVFSFAASDRQQGTVMADHAIDMGATQAITIADVADASAYDQCSAFTDRFVVSGGAITATIEYGDGGLPRSDVGETVNQFVEPDVIILCARPSELRVLTKQLRVDDQQVPLLLGSEGDTLFWLQGQPTLSELWFVSSSSLYGLRSKAETAYIRSLSPAPSGSADLLISTSLVSFAKAVEQTGSLEGLDLAAHLSEVGAVDFLITSAEFGRGNVFTPQGLAIVQVANGFPSLLTILDPNAAPAPPPTTVPSSTVPSDDAITE